MLGWKQGHIFRVIYLDDFYEILIYPIDMGSIKVTSYRFSTKEDIEKALYLAKESIKIMDRK